MKRELCAVNNGGLDQTASSRDGSFAFDKVCLMFFTWPSCEAFCLGFRKPFRYLLVACRRLCSDSRPSKEGLQLALLVSNLMLLKLVAFVFRCVGQKTLFELRPLLTFSSLYL